MAYYYRRRPPTRRGPFVFLLLTIISIFLGLWLGVKEVLSPLSPRRRWRFEPGDSFLCTPMVSKGKVLSSTAEGRFYILDGRSGRTLVKETAVLGSFARPVFISPLAVFAADDFGVYALDVKNRRLAWKFKCGGSVRASPVHADGALIVGDDSGMVWALKIWSGRPLWSWKASGPVKGLCADRRRCFVLLHPREVAALGVADGRLLWKRHFEAPAAPEATAAWGRVFLCLLNGRAICLDGATGREIWQAEVNGPIEFGPCVTGRSIFVATSKGRLVALSTQTGMRVWEAKLKAPPGCFPVSAAGLVVVGDVKGRVYIFDLAGRMLWRGRVAERIWGLSLSPHGRLAVAAGGDGLVLIDLWGG